MKTMARKSRIESEVEHFSNLGHVWWGAKTIAGQRRYDNKAEVFKRICRITKKDKILEIGCGDGEFTKRLAKFGNKVIAVDATPAMIKMTSKKVNSKNVRFAVRDAENLRLKNNSFNIVCGVSILHHLDYEKALREAYRVLNKGGKIFFTEPNILNPHMFLAHKIGYLRKKMELSPYEIAFTKWQLISTLKKAGFRNITVQNYDFLHPKTPKFAIKFSETIGSILERLPLIKEISGSFIICATKF